MTKSEEGFGNEDTRRLIADYPNMLEREKALRADFSIGAFIGYLFAQTGESRNLIAVTDIPQEQFGTAPDSHGQDPGRGSGPVPQPQRRRGPAGHPLPHGANTLPKLG